MGFALLALLALRARVVNFPYLGRIPVPRKYRAVPLSLSGIPRVKGGGEIVRRLKGGGGLALVARSLHVDRPELLVSLSDPRHPRLYVRTHLALLRRVARGGTAAFFPVIFELRERALVTLVRASTPEADGVRVRTEGSVVWHEAALVNDALVEPRHGFVQVGKIFTSYVVVIVGVIVTIPELMQEREA